MLPKSFGVSLVLVGTLTIAAPALAQTKSIQSLTTFLNKKQAKDYKATLIKQETLSIVFPNYKFYAVLFPKYPVAVPPALGLNSSNVVAVSNEGEVKALINPVELRVFYEDNMRPVRTSTAALRVLRSWLILTKEFSQDGYFKFELSADIDLAKAKPGKPPEYVAGQLDVVKESGNKGSIQCKLLFSDAGKLASVVETRKVTAGVRPRVLQEP